LLAAEKPREGMIIHMLLTGRERRKRDGPRVQFRADRTTRLEPAVLTKGTSPF